MAINGLIVGASLFVFFIFKSVTSMMGGSSRFQTPTTLTFLQGRGGGGGGVKKKKNHSRRRFGFCLDLTSERYNWVTPSKGTTVYTSWKRTTVYTPYFLS